MRRGWAWISIASLALAACAAVQNTSNVTPDASPSQAEATTSTSSSPSPNAPLAIAGLPVHAGEIGLAYAPVTLAAKGGVTAYMWSSTAVPPGLVLSPTGVLSGNPTVTGTYSLTLTVSDSAGGSAVGRTTVVVYPQLAMNEFCASKCVVGKGCTKCGTFGSVSKGLAPYSYRVVGGSVPKGMTLKGLALVGGFPIGAASLSVMVTDKLGAQAQVDATWSVYGPAALLKGRTSSPCTNNFSFNVSCSVTWTYSGGNPTVAPKLAITGYLPWTDPNTGRVYSPKAPPAGWAVSIKSGVITISANYADPCVADYAGYINFVLRDPSACATTLSSNTGQLLVDLRYAC